MNKPDRHHVQDEQAWWTSPDGHLYLWKNGDWEEADYLAKGLNPDGMRLPPDPDVAGVRWHAIGYIFEWIEDAGCRGQWERLRLGHE